LFYVNLAVVVYFATSLVNKGEYKHHHVSCSIDSV